MRLHGTLGPNRGVSKELGQRITESDWFFTADESITFRYIAIWKGTSLRAITGERAWPDEDRETTVILGMNPPQNRVEDLGDILLAQLDKRHNLSLLAGDTLTVKWNMT